MLQMFDHLHKKKKENFKILWCKLCEKWAFNRSLTRKPRIPKLDDTFLRLYENQNHLPKIHCHLTRLLRLNVNFTFVQLKRRSYVFTTRTERACQIENNWRKTTTNVLMNLPGIVLFSFRKQLLLFTYAKCIRKKLNMFKYHSVQNSFDSCF